MKYCKAYKIRQKVDKATSIKPCDIHKALPRSWLGLIQPASSFDPVPNLESGVGPEYGVISQPVKHSN